MARTTTAPAATARSRASVARSAASRSTEEQLRKEFEAYGKVTYARIITNRYNGRSKGFGFVHMPNRDEVDAAVKALSDKEILGRKLKCNEAKNVG